MQSNASFSKFLFAASSTFLLAAATSRGAEPEELLLRDYRPESIYRVSQTHVPQARYPVIDMHSHAYAKTDEQVSRWVRIMDEVGIDKTMILTGAVGQRFDRLAALYGKYPDRFALWCGLDYRGYDQPGFGPAAVKELERCRAAGAVGVGELGDKGKGLFYGETKAWGMHLDDPRMSLLLEKCGELEMPINVHVAEPIWMYERMDHTNDGLMNAYKWRLDNQPGILNHSQMIDTLERAVKQHPRTTFIACHFANCSYDLQRLGDLFERYPNLYADIGARFAETSVIPRTAARFIANHQDRLFYGTDMGFNPDMYRLTFRILETDDEHFYAWNQFSYHWPLHGLGLSEGVLQKLYRENALRILDRRF
jgi:predicted TIM-barrel fold metal-dependent hydrolase